MHGTNHLTNLAPSRGSGDFTEVVDVPDRGEDAEFRVTDRRGASREASGEASETRESAGTTESTRAGPRTDEAPAADIRAIPVADLVRIFIGELHARAWVHMGVVVNPATSELAKDLPQARLAIDCIASLSEHLLPFASEAERAELDRMVADLRMNYVRQAGAQDGS